jgi:hypothetical protein
MGSSLTHSVGDLLICFLSPPVSPFNPVPVEEVEDDEEMIAGPDLLPAAEIHTSSPVAELSILAPEFEEWQEKDSRRHSKFKPCVACPYLLHHLSDPHDSARPQVSDQVVRAQRKVERARSASPLNWSVRYESSMFSNPCTHAPLSPPPVRSSKSKGKARAISVAEAASVSGDEAEDLRYLIPSLAVSSLLKI